MVTGLSRGSQYERDRRCASVPDGTRSYRDPLYDEGPGQSQCLQPGPWSFRASRLPRQETGQARILAFWLSNSCAVMTPRSRRSASLASWSAVLGSPATSWTYPRNASSCC